MFKFKKEQMGPYNLFRKNYRRNAVKPYYNQFLNHDYELFFCDRPGLYKNAVSIPHYPWDILFSRETSQGQLLLLSADQGVESRPRIVACNLLKAAGVTFAGNPLLGLVIELHQPGGLDVLAVYNDGSARYIHHSEKFIIWEASTAPSARLIEQLFEQGAKTLPLAKPGTARRQFPVAGRARISFLSSNGIYTAETGLSRLRREKVFGPVFQLGLDMMQYLTRQDYGLKHESGKNVFC